MADQQWYPTTAQLQDPKGIERSMRQTLQQQYDLTERVSGIESKLTVPSSAAAPAAGGPANSSLLGVPVKPIDVSAQPAGTVMTYSPSGRQMMFGTPAGLVPTPATATSPGTPGQLAFDATHVYVCVSANVWVRATLATF